MKKLILLLGLFVPAVMCMAQYRTVDSSQRRAPDWIHSLERNYIIMSAEGSSITEAQQNALMLIKERIVSSVAANVKAESELITEEVNYNNNVTVFLEQFRASVTTQSGDVPYLQGISLSLAEDYYWEKLRDRSTGHEKYRYHVKYPFPEIELRKLVSEFQRMQQELTDELNRLIEEVHKVASVEQINNNISELQTLSASFIDMRKEQALNGISRYRELLNSITLHEKASTLGTLRFVLKAGDRILTTAQRPNLRAECARITGTRLEQNEWVISYDTEYCYDDPENHIEVHYRFGTAPIRQRFYFNIHEGLVDIQLREALQFSALEADDQTVYKARLLITLYNKHDSPFVVEHLTIEFDQMPPIRVEDINQRFENSGNHYLVVDIAEPMDKAATSSANHRLPRINGSIHYHEAGKDVRSSYRIYQHAYTTTW
ncbi:MAG: hypothetical protein RG741_02865 [Bacteroidales bacterium]|nr:hypothetical protein [Bacteroidales bacterium]